MDEETVLTSDYVYEGKAFNVRKDIIVRPDGEKAQRDIVEHPEVIVVVAVDAEGKLLLVNQYRYAVGKRLLEIPAGGIDGDETPEDAVRREMQEETGFLPEKITRLGGFYSAPGFCTEYLYLFLAEELVPSQLYADDTDSIRLVRVEPEEARRLIRTGEICDAKSVAGLYSWLDYRTSN